MTVIIILIQSYSQVRKLLITKAQDLKGGFIIFPSNFVIKFEMLSDIREDITTSISKTKSLFGEFQLSFLE